MSISAAVFDLSRKSGRGGGRIYPPPPQRGVVPKVLFVGTFRNCAAASAFEQIEPSQGGEMAGSS